MTNPLKVATARMDRLIAEALAPAYTTTTPPVKPYVHIAAIELDGMYGRSWSHMPETEVDAFLDAMLGSDAYDLSDWCHSSKCKCGDPTFVL